MINYKEISDLHFEINTSSCSLTRELPGVSFLPVIERQLVLVWTRRHEVGQQNGAARVGCKGDEGAQRSPQRVVER